MKPVAPALIRAALIRTVLVLPVAAIALATGRPASAADIDTQHTRIGFTLKTRLGQVLRGRFPRHEGRIDVLEDGRKQVSLRMATGDIEIVGHPSYTAITRGNGFFEADRFPEIEFVSEPYARQLVIDGGKLRGELRIRNVRRQETFVIEAASCARPGLDCDVVANGVVSRRDYGVDRWMFAVSDVVRFQLRLRVREVEE